MELVTDSLIPPKQACDNTCKYCQPERLVRRMGAQNFYLELITLGLSLLSMYQIPGSQRETSIWVTAVCSLGIVSLSFQKQWNSWKFKFSDSCQGPPLSKLSKDSSLRPALLVLSYPTWNRKPRNTHLH